MEKNKIGIEKIKAVLSMASMAVLSIQHLVGVFADGIKVSYIPLSITFMTVFIGSMDIDKAKGIKWVSLIGAVLIILSGFIIYTIMNYDIDIGECVNNIYTKVMFGCIGAISLILSILYIKRIRELE